MARQMGKTFSLSSPWQRNGARISRTLAICLVAGLGWSAAALANEPPAVSGVSAQDAQELPRQELPRVDVPMPPAATPDFSGANVAGDPPPFKVELPPPAELVMPAAISPHALALKALVEALPVVPANKSVAARAVAAFNKGVADFYQSREYVPVWHDEGKWSAAASSVLTRLQRAGEDGLDLSAYEIPALAAGASAMDPAVLARRELALSRAVAAYAGQASGGRVAPVAISRLITSKPEAIEPAAALAKFSAVDKTGDISAGDILQNFNPPHPGYRALRAKLAEMRREHDSPAPVAIGPGKVLRIGMKDPRVPLIRARFGLSPGQDNGDLTVYDTQVASAVASFQKSQGLRADGRLTPQTVAALSGGQPKRLEADIVANMERWRWLPRDLGQMHLMVNVPEYMVRVFKGGEEIHETRVIVGKAVNQTPIFSDKMQFLVVNPSWNVPVSIIKKEMMPAAQRDPTYFSRRGYEVRQHRGQMIVRQPPGPRNALGLVKFMFPNQHSVYLHDTPGRHLFSAEVRAFSHGCVRVHNPFKLAEIVMSTGDGWNEQRLRSMVGRGERTVHLPQHLPIHIVYFTTFVDENGQLQTRNDIYGHSRRLRAALGYAL